MKLVYYIAHPSQYYIFKNISKYLKQDFEIIITYTDKDVVKNLLDEDNLNFKSHEIGYSRSKRIKFKSLFNFIKKEIDLFNVVKKEKPQIIVGSSVVIAHIGKLFKIPSLIINEDDLDVISISAKIGYPFVTNIISPELCNLGKYEKKAFKYDGYQKLAYLHPNYFIPDESIANKYIDLNQKNFLVRLSALSAHHDYGIKGIDNTQARKLINYLEKFGKVHLSSERVLPNELEKYRLKINPLHLHDILNFTNLLICDSQSMAVEASLLGVPSIRISDFAGRISVLEELENKYRLTFALKPIDFNKVISLIQEKVFLNDDFNLIFRERRGIMLSEKNDIIPFFVSTINNIAKKNNV